MFSWIRSKKSLLEEIAGLKNERDRWKYKTELATETAIQKDHQVAEYAGRIIVRDAEIKRLLSIGEQINTGPKPDEK